MADQVSELRPLHGLRVVDLSTDIAGPYAARLLREAGAAVQAWRAHS